MDLLPEEFEDVAFDDDEAFAGDILRVAVGAELDGERLDRALAASAPTLSRSRVKALLDAGRVARDGATIADASARVKQGQVYVLRVPAAEPATPEPEAIPLAVAYEDAHLLVVNKPAGMVVHPAAGNPRGTLVNALLAHCGASLSGVGGVRRPGIVHRLDKDTSGLMVVAKTDAAHQGLAAQFADRSLSRTYWAVVAGRPSPRAGRIEGNVARSAQNRQKMAVVRQGGKPAITDYRVLRDLACGATLVECKLRTGRTHQIRVHMSHVGWPLVGDPLYGRARPAGTGGARDGTEPARRAFVEFPRQALHAKDIEFLHPEDGRRLSFSSALPADFAALLGALTEE